jgi:hypothetical protein
MSCKLNRIVVFACFAIFLYACKSHPAANETCRKNINRVKAIAYAKYKSELQLDTALHLLNESMQCDSIRMEVVQFKILILVSRKKYADCISFIDSLKESDFVYMYKKRLLSKGIRALEYGSKKDTTKRDSIYREIEDDIDHYLKTRTLSDEEFKEIYTDLFDIEDNYLNAVQINKKLDSLKHIYQEKEFFFDFFRK